MNAVLERLRAQRAEQIATMDAILENVGDERDLVDAERGILEAARARIVELDAQIEPLAGFEALRAAHDQTLSTLPAPAARAGELGRTAPRQQYATAGEFLVDLLRAEGFGRPSDVDEAARARVYAARADQTTATLTGILPTPIVGQVVNLIDANRPLVTSLGGAKAMGGIPGTSFSRPKISTHTQVGAQATQKTALASRALVIDPIPFNKSTYGGTVNVSRQSIDWTSPAAWDIIVRDLADQYAIETEKAASTALEAAITAAAVPVATNDLSGWTTALYTAAMHSYQGAQRMPDRVWCSLNVWAALGSLVDVARVSFPTNGNLDTAAGSSSLADFRGDVLGLPRIVVPTLPAGSCIVGNSSLFEVYEEVIGLLSVVEPSILGVEVAYGGYVAMGAVGAAGLIGLTAPAGIPTMADSGNGAAKSSK